MKDFNLLILVYALASITAVAGANPPHIIHIVADDLGWNDVGYHGGDIKTPTIDRLASESMVLDRFYVTPVCSPTRAGLLTGRYPFRFGIWGGVVSPTKRHGLPPSETTLPEILSKAGYQQRIMLGKWHLGLASTKFHPLNHGFTKFYGHYNGAIDYFSRKRFGELDWHHDFESVHEQGYSTDLIANAAIKYIEQIQKDSPLYMYIAFNAPHSPIQAKRSDLISAGFDPNGPRALNTDRGISKREKAPAYGEGGKGNTVRQTFTAMVSSLDQNVGRILDVIERKGIEENTIVIFHSDNGGVPKHGGDNHPLRGNKFTTWEGGVRVVGMIRWPLKLQGGTTFKSLAAYVDILPTLAAAAGLEVPSGVDGLNLLPYLEGTHLPTNRSLLLDGKTVVTDRWKLKDGSFFNLQEDPEEAHPIKYPPKPIISRLRNDLGQFEQLTGPAHSTLLPKPKNWPPVEWVLPHELFKLKQ